MEKYFKEIVEGKMYKTLQHCFDESKCNDSKIVGSVVDLCKNYETEDFNSWFLHYLSLHGKDLDESTKRLMDDTRMDKDSCYNCIVAFLVYKTWLGVQMERLAKELLYGTKWEVKDANADADKKYGVDLIIVRNNKPLYGIQVKPISYLKKTQQEELPKEVLWNKEKNKKYKEKFGYDVLYIYYNEKKKFDIKEIELIKDKIRELM